MQNALTCIETAKEVQSEMANLALVITISVKLLAVT